MAQFDFSETGEQDLQGFRVPKAGYYHVAVQHVDEYPTTKDGKAIDAIRVDFEILDGTTPGQSGITFSDRFAHPSHAHKDGGKFARARQARLLLATGLMTRADLGKRGLSIDLQQMVARQLIVRVEVETFEMQGGRTGERASVSGLSLWHLDDEEQANVPRDAEMLALVRGSQAANQAVGAGAAAGKRSLNDLDL